MWGTPNEWSNIPKLVARYCIHTQAHLNAVVEYLQTRSKEETTEKLRVFTENELQKANEAFQGYKNKSTDLIDELFKEDGINKAFEKLLDTDFIQFKNYCD